MPIASHSYDAATQAFRVQFKAGGPTYVYDGVEPETAAEIMAGENVGSLVQQKLVRGDYPFNRVDPEEADTEGGDAS